MEVANIESHNYYMAVDAISQQVIESLRILEARVWSKILKGSE